MGLNLAEVPVFGRFRLAVESVWGWRTWCFGPQTALSTCTVHVCTDVQWKHWGLSVEWVADAGGRFLCLWLGPLALQVSADPSGRALRLEAAGRPGRKSTLVSRPVAGRLLSTWRCWRHLGLSVEWAQIREGLAVKVVAGPFGACVEPAYGPAPAT